MICNSVRGFKVLCDEKDMQQEVLDLSFMLKKPHNKALKLLSKQYQILEIRSTEEEVVKEQRIITRVNKPKIHIEYCNPMYIDKIFTWVIKDDFIN